MSTETLHIENVDEEIEIEVEFDYEPDEAMTNIWFVALMLTTER